MIRIVKMEFKPEFISPFLELFTNKKEKIRACEGCLGLSLLQHKEEPGIFFTYSHWQHADYLEQYRTSDLFLDTWRTIKPWFAAKGDAWSVDEIVTL
jgi:quinol monooxygenase YgiN